MDTSLAVVIVAKLPVAGKVKTRLFARFAPPAAALLHEHFLVHTVRRIQSLKLGTTVVLFDPPDQVDAFKSLIEDPVEFLPQIGGDLGARIAACVTQLRERFARIVFLGSDSPDVPDADIRAAADSLAKRQLCLGPTEDGGFWTIGFGRGVDVETLLKDIPWSSGTECEAVLVKAAAMHLEVQVGGRWSDVDRPSDVDALLWRLEHSRSPADVRLFSQIQHIVLPNERIAGPATTPSHA
jgi:rSAM/selenodomain-associated transferase 1